MDTDSVTVHRNADGRTFTLIVTDPNAQRDTFCRCDRHPKPHTHTFEHRDGGCYLFTDTDGLHRFNPQ